jgi:hypothetical protein
MTVRSTTSLLSVYEHRLVDNLQIPVGLNESQLKRQIGWLFSEFRSFN